MFSWLLPKEVHFFAYFSQHAAIVTLAAEELHATQGSARQRSVRIEQLEAEADQIAHQCVEGLRNTFITPIDRHDIFRLITRMDDIVDMIDETARTCAIYQLGEPDREFRTLAEILVKAARSLELAVQGLNNLKNAAPIMAHCIAINERENEADRYLPNALQALFALEPDLRLVIKRKEIYEKVECAINRCEEVANIIEGIILEHV